MCFVDPDTALNIKRSTPVSVDLATGKFSTRDTRRG